MKGTQKKNDKLYIAQLYSKYEKLTFPFLIFNKEERIRLRIRKLRIEKEK